MARRHRGARTIDVPGGLNSFDLFFLAMARWQSGQHQEARGWFDRAVESMRKTRGKSEELDRFHAEAARLLGIGEIRSSVREERTPEGTQPGTSSEE